MSSWPPGTRNRLIVVVLAGVGILLCGWFGVVSPLQARLNVQRGKAELARMQLQLAQTGQDRGPYYRALVEERRQEMSDLEIMMANQDDPFIWNYRTLVTYLSQYAIVAQGWEAPVITDVDVPPELPHRMATFGLTGQAHFHAFGAFLAALENDFPFLKIKHVTLQAVNPGISGMVRGGEDLEQLRFRVEYQCLISTNSIPEAKLE